MKVRHTQEWDAPRLPKILEQASARSDKTITEICAIARVSTSFWYGLLSGKQQSIKLETLKNFCRALDLDLSEILRKEK